MYDTFTDMDQVARTVTGGQFFVHLSGTTLDAHESWVENLKGIGQIQVSSAGESDYLMVFCPIVSRIGTDISEAMDNLPARNKKIILVVMHHTFDGNHVVTQSSRQVENPNVILTVDCLFYKGKFLNCDRNDIAWFEVQKALGYSPSMFSPSGSGILSWFKRNLRPIGFAITFIVVGLILTTALTIVLTKGQ